MRSLKCALHPFARPTGLQRNLLVNEFVRSECTISYNTRRSRNETPISGALCNRSGVFEMHLLCLSIAIRMTAAIKVNGKIVRREIRKWLHSLTLIMTLNETETTTTQWA